MIASDFEFKNYKKKKTYPTILLLLLLHNFNFTPHNFAHYIKSLEYNIYKF
jgi:hypothetical protein